MIGTFAFYMFRSLRNRVAAALHRLKQPKYLISAIAGLGYMYLAFFRNFFSHSARHPNAPFTLQPEMFPLIETAAAFALLFLVLLPWIWPGRSSGLKFTEAEIQFMFPAPISRRTLIHYRLVKMQLGILFGVLVSFVFFGRGRFLDHPVFIIVALWIAYSFIALYQVGVSLVQTSVAEHGASGFKRQAWVLGLLACLLASIFVWMKYFIEPVPSLETRGMSALVEWIAKVTHSGPAYIFLYPFRSLVHPAFAADAVTFMIRLIPALAILGSVYLWVVWTDYGFEEASVERARKTALRLEAARSGSWNRRRPAAIKVRRPPFNLAPTGSAHTAIFWKNLVSAGRLSPRRVLPVVAVLGIGLSVTFSRGGGSSETAATIIGGVALAVSGFLALLGPVMVRDDLRGDLLHFETLKTYPVNGAGLVLGEVLAPAVILGIAECGLVLVAAIALPGLGKIHLTAAQRLEFGLSAALLLPCFSLIGVLIQNAAALIWPGWVELGKFHRQGIEAMGQRLITMAGTFLTFAIVVIPAAVFFAAVYFAGAWFAGMAILPVAALAAALVLIVEAGFGILWLGRIYDRFDVSRM